jgi:tRNA-specific 2-thiouridylase
MSDEFHSNVVENFLAEYARGNTPNPCLRCNEKIKFEAVLDRAQAMGFDGVVTGHYAQTRESKDGKLLYRAVDPAKDQSYVLAVLNRDQVQGAYFPLGDTVKDDVRLEADRRGLSVANKPDSHDICFVPSGNNASWLRERLGSTAGDIVDESGNKLGEHQGAYTYTVGQRKGLGITTPTASGEPRYVLRIEPVTNTVVVGEHNSLAVHRVTGERPIWCGPAPEIAHSYEGFLQVRAHGQPLRCTYSWDGTEVKAQLLDPLFGLAAGQAMVMYDGDRVVGSATVKSTS